MSAWSETTIQDVNLEALAQVIHERGRPVHLNQLARAAVRARLQAEAGERLYAPGAQYTLGETIRFSDQSATVKAVKAGGNPKQGPFKILTLALPDGTERYMAAEVPGAPAEDRQPVTDEQVGRIIEQHGLAIRMAVQEALGADDRFVWFQDAQGDHWCLAEMLPEVRDEELAQVWPLLQGRLRDGVLDPCPTEAMVKAIWGQENDGSEAYLLKAFALNAALWQCQDVRRLGNGWVLEDEWQQLQERPALVGPRQPNVVTLPEGVEPVEEDEEEPAEAEEEEPPAEAETIEEDLEAWRRNRLLNATITLKAQHYYGNWLPLTQAMRRVFPPRASGADTVTFYHRFGGEEESFQAWVDWDQGRILGSPQMYQAFHDHGIYPGAKLVISHRGSEQEYDIRTKPVQGEQNVLVRRVFLAKDGTLEYEEVKEPIRYEIAQDVFVADARWEDLEALFRQAEEAGAGIFQLMYEKCCEWWEENDRQPLYVTAEDLFQAIHFDDQGRLTSKATIAWELWRRLAFEPAGDGKYRFRPEKGDRVRSVRPGRLGPRPVVAPPGPKVRKDKSLQGIAGKTAVMLPPVQPAAKPAEERSAVELPPQPPTAVIAPAVKVPDIGIRHIVYPIPFNDAPLAHETREILWERVGPIQRGSELTLWAPETPERLDEYLMQCIADRDANRFVTPRPVVDFMVNLAQPKPGERVADICCGTGIFLVKALRFVKEVYGEDADLELYGADIYDKAVEATRLNLLANGARNFTVVQADSLREQGGIFAQKYDLILGNPPFGGGQALRFLQRWIELLREGGRVVANVPTGLLVSSQQEERRQWLLSSVCVNAVVSLPHPSDSRRYGAKSNVLALVKTLPSDQQKTLLIRTNGTTEFESALNSFPEENKMTIHFFKLNIISERDPAVVVKEQAELIERMDPGFWDPTYLSLFEVLGQHTIKPLGTFIAEMRQGDVPRSRLGERYEEEGIRFIRAENLVSTGLDLTLRTYISERHYERIARAAPNDHDILIGRHGVASTGRVIVFMADQVREKCAISSHLNVIRLKPSVDPFYLVAYLKSKFGQSQIERYESGVGSTGIRFDQIKSILVPLLEKRFTEAVRANYLLMHQYHARAIQAKENMIQAHERGNAIAEHRYRAEYERNIAIAEAMLNDLIRQVEEIIEGKRTEIEPVDRILKEAQGGGA